MENSRVTRPVLHFKCSREKSCQQLRPPPTHTLNTTIFNIISPVKFSLLTLIDCIFFFFSNICLQSNCKLCFRHTISDLSEAPSLLCNVVLLINSLNVAFLDKICSSIIKNPHYYYIYQDLTA